MALILKIPSLTFVGTSRIPATRTLYVISVGFAHDYPAMAVPLISNHYNMLLLQNVRLAKPDSSTSHKYAFVYANDQVW